MNDCITKEMVMRKLAYFIVMIIALAGMTGSGFAASVLKSGIIKGQSVKWTTGSVRIVKSGAKHQLTLGNNFKTKKGPALYVYLGNEKPEKRIGRLKSTNGMQSYDLSERIDISKYSRVFIYCVPFRAVFGVGKIN